VAEQAGSAVSGIVISAMRSRAVRICAVAFGLSLSGAVLPDISAHAASAAEARRQPMTFTWHPARAETCATDCREWIAAVGVITGDTPEAFDQFAKGRDLKGVRIVLDSSGGSVLDTITMGRTWRRLGVHTSVGMVREVAGKGRTIAPEAYCESMCVFLLLAGTARDVPPQAHVRVHQIWMGDRADKPQDANYSAHDLMIVERDIGRLAKYTFDMGGSGDLLALSLSVPPWEALHQLSPAELRAANLLTNDVVAGHALPKADAAPQFTAGIRTKPVQDRFVSTESTPVARSTRTAEAQPPTGGTAPAAGVESVVPAKAGTH
jgi:hypothetical protein